MSYRYPASTIVRDYLLGGVGLALFLLPLLAFDLPDVTAYICSLVSVLFIFHLGQTVIRHRTCIEMDDRVIRNRGNQRSVAWSEMTTVALKYFSVRRDRDAGWLELRLGSEKQSIHLDSRIEGFNAIAEQAARVADQNRLALDNATVSNFDALGIQPTTRSTPRG